MYLVVSPVDIRFTLFGWFDGHSLISEQRVETEPEALLRALVSFLETSSVEISLLDGIIAVVGPGSPSSLRAGLSVVNTIGFTEEIPLFGVENPDHEPLSSLLQKVNLLESQTVLLPLYGREANITPAR